MVLERIIDLMSDILQRDADPLLTLDDDGGVTLLDVARLVISVEHAFAITIPDECAAEWATLSDASDFVDDLLEAGEAGTPIKDDEDRAGWFYA